MRATSLWKSFACAFAGLWYVVRRGRNVRIQMALGLAVVVLAAILRLSVLEWAILVLTIGVLLAAETFNTVIEAIVDLVSPEHHELAKAAKDAAAGAVLLLSMAAVVVGLLILGPPLYERLFG